MSFILFFTFLLSVLSLLIAAYYGYQDIINDLDRTSPEIKDNQKIETPDEKREQILIMQLEELIDKKIKNSLNNDWQELIRKEIKDSVMSELKEATQK